MTSKLLKNGTVLCFNPSTSSIDSLANTHLLIVNDIISHISSDLSTLPTPASAEVIDCTNKIISPGFVDTHRHTWQTAYRTLAPNATLSEYFLRFGQTSPRRDVYTDDDLYVSTLAGHIDALNSGVTSIVEHAHNNWSKGIFHAGLKASLDGGARIWWCYNPLTDEPEGWTFDDQMDELKRVAGTLSSDARGKDQPGASLLKLGLAYDGFEYAPSSHVDNMKSLVRQLPLEALTFHFLGPPWPFALNVPLDADKHGLLDLDVPSIFSHGGYITPEQIQLLRQKNHFLSITPESEMHYGHGQRTSRHIHDRACLGIDTEFTFSGDILSQARLWLQNCRKEIYEETLSQGKIPRENPMSAEQGFLMATHQGGKALRRDDIGVLTAGAKADLVVFDAESTNLCGFADAVAAVMLHANVGDIESVMVGGEWRKKDGKMVGSFGGMAWEEVREKFKDVARRIQAKNREPAQFPETLFGSEFGGVERVRL